MGTYARVAVVRPVSRSFHYSIPDRLRPWTRVGVRCLVSFGGSRVVGFVIGLDEEAETAAVRELSEVLDLEPPLPEDLFSLGLWLCRYYHHPLGETLSALLPPAFAPRLQPVYRVPNPRPPCPSRGSLLGRFWEDVMAQGEVAAASLGLSDLALVAELSRLGLLDREWRTRPPGGLASDERYSLLPGAPEPGRLPRAFSRQIALLKALSDGPQSARALSARGVSRNAIRRAVSRGWVERQVERSADLQIAKLETLGYGDADSRPDLTAEQEAALGGIIQALESGEFRACLLHGVTGSGKTEVYLRAVEEARRRGRGAIVLVPEISLTPALIGRFVKQFGADLAVLHSGLGDAERRHQWERLREGKAWIAVGARSAVFAPVTRLGLIVVDEEHEPSYKQEEGLRYHAKHVALMRVRMAGAVGLLGSATPDVETYWGVRSGRYRRLALPRRILDATAPEVRVVDLRQEESRRRLRVMISSPLKAAVEGALSRGEQALLFLNRRGFSPALACSGCGGAVNCPRCSVALTLHRRNGQSFLLCHYCDVRRRPPEACPTCGAPALAPAGVGTQRLTEVAAQLWPGARLVRLDRDSARGGGGAGLLESFHRGEGDILVGTQMVAKGHHFPRLTVVGVVDADLSLNFPDFRAAERTFQVLTQVAGRAGREQRPGVAFLQTRNPFHPVLSAVASGDYEGFADAELRSRQEAGFPPFRRLAMLRISARSEAEARAFALQVSGLAKQLGKESRVEIAGPTPAPMERVRGRYRFQILLRAPGPEPGPLQTVLGILLAHPRALPGKDVRLHADVDPVSML